MVVVCELCREAGRIKVEQEEEGDVKDAEFEARPL